MIVEGRRSYVPYPACSVENLRETDRVLHGFLDTYDTHMDLHQQE
jgi:hypothetical protein